MSAYQCIGGPVDGVYFQLVNGIDEPAGVLVVDLPLLPLGTKRIRLGHSYAYEHGGGTAEVDYIRLSLNILHDVPKEPTKDQRIFNMFYTGAMTDEELKTALKNVRKP